MIWTWPSIAAYLFAVFGAGLLVFIYGHRIDAPGTRFWFRISVAGSAFYAACMTVFLAPGLSDPLRHIISKCTFVVAQTTFFAALLFWLYYTGSLRELRRWPMQILLALGLVVFVLIPVDLVSAGVHYRTPTEPRPVYGPAYPLFLVLALFIFVYLVRIYTHVRAFETDRQLRFQFEVMGRAMLATFACFILFNGFGPRLLNTSLFTPFSILFLLIFWSAALWFLTTGEFAYAGYALYRLRSVPSNSEAGGGRAVGMLLDHLRFILTQRPSKLRRRVDFPGSVQLYVSVGEEPKKLSKREESARQILRMWATEQAHQMQSPALGIRSAATVLKHRRVPIQEYPLYLDQIISLSNWIIDNNRAVLDSALFSSDAPALLTMEHYTPSLRTALLETLDRAEPLYAGRAIVHLDTHLDFPVKLPPDLLRALILNLLKNSIRAMEASESAALHFSMIHEPPYNCLILADNGHGIPADRIEEITRAGVSYSGSTGFGLSFCQNLMHFAGGRLRILSEPGLYTLVVLEFP